ncbi:ParB N-terminal domain-containing protein [Burkholderia ubonensis]|uniref:ParB N-terminal domain-containing protein n=1 Tax=Burkholderia ubonensis TaxID=101571 RepID=UPI0012FC09EB|nr:ParB N-terminal domain-containing protein [Burkholderia ubonensis]
MISINGVSSKAAQSILGGNDAESTNQEGLGAPIEIGGHRARLLSDVSAKTESTNSPAATSVRLKRALQEPQYNPSQESWSEFQARHYNWQHGTNVPPGSKFIPEDQGAIPRPTLLQVVTDIALGIVTTGPLPKFRFGSFKPTVPKPSGGPKPAEPRPAEPRPAEPRPAEPRPAEPRPAEPRPAEPKPAEPKPAEPKPAELKPAELKPAELKPAELKPAELKPAEPSATQETISPDPVRVDAETWRNSDKSGMDPDVVKNVDDAFEFGQEVYRVSSNDGKDLYLIQEDNVFIRVDNNDTWTGISSQDPAFYDYPVSLRYEVSPKSLGNVRGNGYEYVPIESVKMGRSESTLESERLDAVLRRITNGQSLDAVEVESNGDGTYNIVNGNHRYQAAQKLGLTTIPIKVV